jgi:YggT family protein
MISLVILIDTVLDLYMWVFIVSAVLSWLVAFNVINTYNRFIAVVMDILSRLTEPLLKPIRRVMPVMGGLDLSPMVAIFGIFFVRLLLREYLLGGLR